MNRARRAFTIVELLVVVSIIALLIGILLPAIGKARDQAKLSQSQSNLRNMGVAHGTYAAEWNDRHLTLTDDNLGRYAGGPSQAISNYNSQNGYPHPGLLLGHGNSGGIWGYYFSNPNDNNAILQPMSFGGPVDSNDSGDNAGFGWFRMPNCKAFSVYLNGKFYDPVFYAPKDVLSYEAASVYFDDPGEFNTPDGYQIYLSSYCMSPAALFSPDVLANPDRGGFKDPWSLNSGFRCPSASQAKYPDLKTHMIEHQWLQQKRVDCNRAFVGHNFDGCEPYYFNHSWESVPVTLFYDGHVEGLGVRDAEAADTRMSVQSGHGLWSRDTPFGGNGYFIDSGYDFASTSFHILTTDGIFGRDTIAR
ncbi:MAG: type II secretion system protein [Planctomycetota bacterium]|jgi:prepilin-type N-terminal cleavage/methylation domain-containing protein